MPIDRAAPFAAIEPSAAVLITDNRLERIIAACGALESLLNTSVADAIGAKPAALIGERAAHRFRNALAYPAISLAVEAHPVDRGAEGDANAPLEAALHKDGDYGVIEVTASDPSPRPANLLGGFVAQAYTHGDKLLRETAEIIRGLCAAEHAVAWRDHDLTPAPATTLSDPLTSALSALFTYPDQRPASLVFNAAAELSPTLNARNDLTAPLLLHAEAPALRTFLTSVGAHGGAVFHANGVSVACWSTWPLTITSEAARAALIVTSHADAHLRKSSDLLPTLMSGKC